MSIEITHLTGSQLTLFKELIRVFEDVFEMKDFQIPDDAHLQQLLGRPDFFVFVALANGKVIGGLTAYSLRQYYSKLPLVYIYDLAVKTEFQRRGVGKQLIAGITRFCREIKVEEIFVQADEEDLHALDFYRATGATAEKVVHFYYPLNPITHPEVK